VTPTFQPLTFSVPVPLFFVVFVVVATAAPSPLLRFILRYFVCRVE